MRRRVASGRRGWFRIARETVVTCTPALRATSDRVMRLSLMRGNRGGVDLDRHRSRALYKSIVSMGHPLRANYASAEIDSRYPAWPHRFGEARLLSYK